ncbi:MAG: glutamate 5-kinase [Planctomycetota bacterium]|nr:glutamate 5-kinase [Planctomycetota bacterium]
MSNQQRRDLMQRVRSVVVKLGSNVLCDDAGLLEQDRIDGIAGQVADLEDAGLRVAVVSSGAIAAGVGEMDLPRRPDDLPRLQACAAVGQAKLMMRFDAALRRRGRHAAQILLVRGDVEDRGRYLNIRHCIAALQAYGAVPVINENDTVSVDEIRFGENDVLAAMVTNLLRADLLVLLTTVDGVFRDKARRDRFDVVHDVAEVETAVDATRSTLGSGGMATKLEAAGLVVAAGEMAAIADGRRDAVLADLVAGRPVGTLFVPTAEKMTARRRWIGLTRRPRGKVVIDDGAARAVRGRKSLLASGITAVEGAFAPGDIIAVVGPDGKPIAQGLTNYASDDVDRIKGLRSSQFRQVLGDRPYDEVIHADNLVVTA